MKTCTKCGERKALSSFYADSSKRDGRQSRCKGCNDLASATRRPDRGRQWYAANPERAREQFRKYYATHREESRVRAHRYRARAANAAISDLTTSEWVEIRDAANGMCFYCGSSVDSLTQDHFIPLSKGGDHTKTNIVAACGWCNRSKKDKMPEEFMASLTRGTAIRD